MTDQITITRKGGRPKKPIDYKKVEKYAAQGMTKEQISLCLGITADTLANRGKEDPVLLETIQRGQAKGIDRVTRKLLAYVAKGNMTAIIFYLKCKAGWKETSVIEFKKPEEIPENFNDVTAASQMYEETMRTMGLPMIEQSPLVQLAHQPADIVTAPPAASLNTAPVPVWAAPASAQSAAPAQPAIKPVPDWADI